MGYATTKDVAAYCSNLITGAADFSTATLPTKAQVQNWLDRGAAVINNTIGSRGFAAPTDSTTDAWLWLQDLNAYYAVSQAEMARTNVRLAPGERTRGQQFYKMWQDGLKELKTTDLTANGMAYSHRGYVGGVSVSEKDAVADQGDREPLGFGRGQFDNPSVQNTSERDEDRLYGSSRRKNATNV